MKIDNDKAIKIISFWQDSLNGGELFHREVMEKIDFDSKEIVDVIGPRRSGKSSLLKLIINRFDMTDNFLYVNFEDPFFIENKDADVIEELIEIYEEYFNKDLKYLFFDEIQEVTNWEKAIRKLRDGTNYKIFITGSSSVLLSKELSSLITGRHLTTKMMPLNFREYLFFKKIIIDSHKDIVLKEKIINKKFEEYMGIGGFPAVVLDNNKELLKDYFYDFLQKDIVSRYDIRDKDAIEKMAIFLMSNSSKIVSIESMKKAFDLTFESVTKYLEYLKDAFVIFELNQFSFSLKKQNKALSKMYSVDTGLAQSVSFTFSQNNGRILENVIFLHLLRDFDNIYYYKTKNNLEVDFLVREKQKNKQLIQVCWDLKNDKTRKREVKALVEAMHELKMNSAIIITRNESEKIIIDKKEITVVPVWKWLLDKKS